MKKLLATLAVSAFAFITTTSQAEAGHGRGGYNSPPQNQIYVSGYRHGRPVYTEKYFVGWDDCGRPRFAYRTVVGHGGHRGGHHYDRGYDRGYQRDCDAPRYGYGHSSSRYHSGSRVSVSFGF